MTIFDPQIKQSIAKYISISPLEESLLIGNRNAINGKEKLTQVCVLENWGKIYQICKSYEGDREKKVDNVLYMNPQRAALYEIVFNTKRCQWERNGQPLPEGSYEFIITKNWKMLAFTNKDEDEFNAMIKEKNLASKVFFKHTSFTSGGQVYFSGTAKIEKGLFTWNGRSGHYRPQAIHVSVCKAWLKNHGVIKSIYIKSPKETVRKNNKRIIETVAKTPRTNGP